MSQQDVAEGQGGLPPSRDAGTAMALLLCLGVVAVVRVACFPFSVENADGPARIALAIRWLQHPTIMSVKDCSQFGPLPIFLDACILRLWNDPYSAPRFVSLIFGIATAAPLFLLTNLLFGGRAAVFATIFLALNTLHARSCGTAMAEAPFGFFMMACLFLFFRFRRDRRWGDLCGAAALLSVACLVRYEGAVYIPLLGLLAIFWGGTGTGQSWMRRAASAMKPALLFVAIASICPIVWMTINAVKVGDPMWGWHFIAEDHVQMSSVAVAERGFFGSALYNLCFFPGVLFISMTPAIAVLAALGVGRALRRRETLAYAVLFLPMVAFFAQTLWVSMTPLARFLTLTGMMLLPYAGAMTEGWRREGLRRRTIVVVASAAVVFLGLAVAAYLPGLPLHQKLWSVSPVAPLPPEEGRVAELLKARLGRGYALAQDSSVFTHVVTFNASPDIYEHWWARPAIDKLPTVRERIRYLESSAPAVLVLDAEANSLGRLLAIEGEQGYEGDKIRLGQVYSSRRFAVYEVMRR